MFRSIYLPITAQTAVEIFPFCYCVCFLHGQDTIISLRVTFVNGNTCRLVQLSCI